MKDKLYLLSIGLNLVFAAFGTYAALGSDDNLRPGQCYWAGPGTEDVKALQILNVAEDTVFYRKYPPEEYWSVYEATKSSFKDVYMIDCREFKEKHYVK